MTWTRAMPYGHLAGLQSKADMNSPLPPGASISDRGVNRRRRGECVSFGYAGGVKEGGETPVSDMPYPDAHGHRECHRVG